ncbi:Putative N-acetylmannosaminyltransferase [Thalassovita gelatinovora]|uniref:Putative N-acetylmannosaminyltransferase n=1 Tax=Thalassovita gelatinovora TaxID=53501 RepID=A0A0P1FVR4_THAGE|nr:WecB/TagA/CpsF family glycosyltransferase [Thalassovita gelatinovora]QIZ81172.1 WecB/TagA/CpsF family glycosyltransferase [Thalassovita gelatinovora]CUH64776.1 Putative N-acetylmannosaminyltransferase [Thalassovita gelatinovora]SEP92244.1 polymer biosynthesis protein, WecB/TagA/CpsF family [Thalassovita gelatinovora]
MKFWVGAYEIDINIANRAALEDAVKDRFKDQKGFALATLNMDHLDKLRHDSAFRAAYGAQDLVVADGNPIVWMSKLAGRPVDLMPGSDLVIPLAQLCAACDVPMALVGSTQDSLERAANVLRQQTPGLRIVASIAPAFGFDPEGEQARDILQQIAASGARFCFLALGAPKQERFAALGRELTPEIGFASVGAGLDFLAGSQTRAPLWVRKLALEWLWRLLSSPSRLAGRYARSFTILPGHVLRSLFRKQTL